MCRAGSNPGPMADPPAGLPEASPTNTQGSTVFSVEDFQPRVNNIPTRVTRKRGRHNEGYTPEEASGRVTTREVWKLIDELKDIIHRQTALIESTKAELQEVKHDQNVLHKQNRSFMRKSKPCEHNSKVRWQPPQPGRGRRSQPTPLT